VEGSGRSVGPQGGGQHGASQNLGPRRLELISSGWHAVASRWPAAGSGFRLGSPPDGLAPGGVGPEVLVPPRRRRVDSLQPLAGAARESRPARGGPGLSGAGLASTAGCWPRIRNRAGGDAEPSLPPRRLDGIEVALNWVGRAPSGPGQSPACRTVMSQAETARQRGLAARSEARWETLDRKAIALWPDADAGQSSSSRNDVQR